MNLDEINAESAYWHSLSKDCLAKTWWNADLDRAPCYRALKISPTDPGASYAVAPFRIARHEGRYVILAAWPAPCLFDPPDEDWLNIETVMVWHPNADTIETPEDSEPQLVGRLSETQPTIYAKPFAFFRAWAEQRASLAIARQLAARKEWHIGPTEFDEPGLLMLGKPEAIRWGQYNLPARFDVVGTDPAQINKAILKNARVPRASAQASSLRRAA